MVELVIKIFSISASSLVSILSLVSIAAASDDLPKISGARVLTRLITLPDPAVPRVGVSPDRRYAYVVASDVVQKYLADQPKYWTNVELNSRFYVFDLKNPARPASSDMIKLSDFGSDFGTWVDDRLCFHVGKTDHDEDVTIVFDVHKPIQPKLLTSTEGDAGANSQIPAECAGLPRRMPKSIDEDYRDGFNTIIDGEQLVLTDRYEDKEITVGRRGLEVWQEHPGRLPVRQALITMAGGVGIEHRFVANNKILVSGLLYHSSLDNSLKEIIVTLEYSKPPMDWPHLLTVYHTLLALHAPAQDTNANDNLSSQLTDAGAPELLVGMPDPMRRSSTVRILNDWGFWLSRGTKPSSAIPVLEKVVAIQPNRLVAWRNLLDAIKSALQTTTSHQDTVRLIRIAGTANTRIDTLSANKRSRN